MAPEVTLECLQCHHQVCRPVHISATGFALVSWPNITCGCGGKMVINKKPENTTGSAVIYGKQVETETHEIRHKSECEKAIEAATPYWVHAGDRDLIRLCEEERLLILPDGRQFKISEVNNDN